jgi:hypothetical protein
MIEKERKNTLACGTKCGQAGIAAAFRKVLLQGYILFWPTGLFRLGILWEELVQHTYTQQVRARHFLIRGEET